jgi:hypothetical protein
MMYNRSNKFSAQKPTGQTWLYMDVKECGKKRGSTPSASINEDEAGNISSPAGGRAAASVRCLRIEGVLL